MLAVERRSEIQKLVFDRKSVLVADLAKMYDVTEETIRRDLNVLEKSGAIVRTYGGAYLKNSIEDVDISQRREDNVPGKNIIAAISRNLVENGDTIFLDSSTTASYIASAISDMQLTIVTNSLAISNILSKCPSVNLICLGGLYNPTHDAFVGASVLQHLQKMFFTKAFISTHSLSMNEGITDTNEEIASIRIAVAKRCNALYLAVGSEKFDRISFIKSLSYDSVTGLITDSCPSSSWLNFLQQHNISIYCKD